MTSAKFTNECRSFCRISSILISEVEDGLDETQITDQVYSQYNVGINIRLQLTESPERLTRRGMALRSSVLVPMSSSYSLDLHGWNLEGYPKAKGEFSTGNIWSRSTTKEEIS